MCIAAAAAAAAAPAVAAATPAAGPDATIAAQGLQRTAAAAAQLSVICNVIDVGCAMCDV